MSIGSISQIPWTQIASVSSVTKPNIRQIGPIINVADIAGYAFGGALSTATSEIDGLSFADETAINPAAVLAVPVFHTTGASHFPTASAYILGGGLGGIEAPLTRHIQKFSYPTQTSSYVGETLSSTSSHGPAGESPTSATSGYVSGYIDGVASLSVIKFNFTVETSVTFANILVAVGNDMAGFNSAANGIFVGGGWRRPQEIDGIAFATDTAYNPAAQTRHNLGNRSGVHSRTAGYALGGAVGPVWWQAEMTNQVDKFIFATETSLPVGDLATLFHAGAAVHSSTTGYSMGGLLPGHVRVSTMSRYPFATEVGAVIAATLAVARYAMASASYTSEV